MDEDLLQTALWEYQRIITKGIDDGERVTAELQKSGIRAVIKIVLDRAEKEVLQIDKDTFVMQGPRVMASAIRHLGE